MRAHTNAHTKAYTHTPRLTSTNTCFGYILLEIHMHIHNTWKHSRCPRSACLSILLCHLCTLWILQWLTDLIIFPLKLFIFSICFLFFTLLNRNHCFMFQKWRNVMRNLRVSNCEILFSPYCTVALFVSFLMSLCSNATHLQIQTHIPTHAPG